MPLRQNIAQLGAELRAVEEGFESLSRVVCSDYGKKIITAMHEHAAHDMRPKMYELFGAKDEIVTVQISSRDLRFLRPDDALKRVLDIAEEQITRRAKVRARSDRANHATVITISVPSFSISQTVVSEILDYPRGITSPRRSGKGG